MYRISKIKRRVRRKYSTISINTEAKIAELEREVKKWKESAVKTSIECGNLTKEVLFLRQQVRNNSNELP